MRLANSSAMFKILLLALLWGPSFLFIKIAVQEIAPVSIVALRISLSAVLLLFVLKMKKITLPRDPKLWLHCFFMGIFASSLPFILYGYSLERIDSILSALINSTTPVSTLILANSFLKDERFTYNRCIGVALGITGFFILCLPTLFQNNLDNPSSDLSGMLLSLAAATCYAIGMVYARKNIKPPKEPLVLPTLQLLTSLVYLIPLALWIDPPLNVFTVSWQTQVSIVGLAILGTFLAFIIYYQIVMKHGATAISMVTYILPLFSIVIGVLFGNETVHINFCIASCFILLGIMVANNVITFPFWKLRTR